MREYFFQTFQSMLYKFEISFYTIKEPRLFEENLAVYSIAGVFDVNIYKS